MGGEVLRAIWSSEARGVGANDVEGGSALNDFASEAVIEFSH